MRNYLPLTTFVAIISILSFFTAVFAQHAEEAAKEDSISFKTLKGPAGMWLHRFKALRAIDSKKSISLAIGTKSGVGKLYSANINKKGKASCKEIVALPDYLDAVWLTDSSNSVSPGGKVNGGLYFFMGVEFDDPSKTFPRIIKIHYGAGAMDANGKFTGDGAIFCSLTAPAGRYFSLVQAYFKATGGPSSAACIFRTDIYKPLSENTGTLERTDCYYVEVGPKGKAMGAAQQVPYKKILNYNNILIYRPFLNGPRWLIPVLINNLQTGLARGAVVTVVGKAGSPPGAYKIGLKKVYEMDTTIDAQSWYEYDEDDALMFLPIPPKKSKSGNVAPPKASNVNLLIQRDYYRMFLLRRNVKKYIQQVNKRGAKKGALVEVDYPETWDIFEDYTNQGKSFANNFQSLSRGVLMDDGRVAFVQSRSLGVYMAPPETSPTGTKVYKHQIDLLALNQKTGKMETLASAFPDTGGYYDLPLIDALNGKIWIIQPTGENTNPLFALHSQ